MPDRQSGNKQHHLSNSRGSTKRKASAASFTLSLPLEASLLTAVSVVTLLQPPSLRNHNSNNMQLQPVERNAVWRNDSYSSKKQKVDGELLLMMMPLVLSTTSLATTAGTMTSRPPELLRQYGETANADWEQRLLVQQQRRFSIDEELMATFLADFGKNGADDDDDSSPFFDKL